MSTENFKAAIDGASIGTVIAAWAGWLPEIAALFTLIWTILRIYEMDTTQRVIAWFRSWFKWEGKGKGPSG